MPELSRCRREILALLGDSECTGRQLADTLGREQTNIARDLRALLKAGLVTRRRSHPYVLYRAAKEVSR